MKLIIKGDDLGWSEGINLGIEKTAKDGILTATGCMVNMPAAQHGIDLLKRYPHISIGQHTNVTIGKPISPPESIPHMVDSYGNFLTSTYYRNLNSRIEDVLPYYEEGKREIEAQLFQFIKLAGKKPDYLEGHAIPSKTFECALYDVAHQYSIPYIKDQTYHQNASAIYHASIGHYAMDIFNNPDPYAQFFADAESYIINDEAHILDHEYAILIFHPGYVDASIMDSSSFHGVRMRDVQALCSIKVKQWIEKHHIQLINYSYIGGDTDEI